MSEVRPTMTDPFALFGVKPAFAVDLETIERARERALVKVHPDRFADRSAAERRIAEQWTARINEAWDLLRDPVRRAAWLCGANGAPLNAETDTSMPPAFLMRQIEWREAQEAGGEALAAAKADACVLRDKTLVLLADAIDGRAAWSEARALTRELMFVERFLAQMKH